MAAAELQRREDFLVEQEPFRYNAFLIIVEMVELERQRPTTGLVDEILHSILFLGKINTLPFTPQEILSDDLLLNTFRTIYRRPFALYSSEVPRRGPFSCLLDMVVHVKGQDKEGAIIDKLHELIGRLRGGSSKLLVSRTICVSQSNPPGSVRYYGVSMFANGSKAQRILIGVSCLSKIWDSYVADAVMTFYPETGTWPFVRKPYFDGTIRVPENVRCQTFDLYNGGLKPPCKSCHELFGLTTTETTGFPYGNCAEAESLSNLFKNDAVVRGQVQPTAVITPQNRETARTRVLEAVRGFVQSFEGFNQWRDRFYTPML